MKITDQLLAAYAEGNVTEEERRMVRRHLVDHPDQIEMVVTMMDEDFELEVDDDADNDTIADSSSIYNSFSDLCYSAAAFVPRKKSTKNSSAKQIQHTHTTFQQRLNELLDEIS